MKTAFQKKKEAKQQAALVVSTLALSGLLPSEPQPSADTRENQIGKTVKTAA
jgi:hypothetical protein